MRLARVSGADLPQNLNIWPELPDFGGDMAKMSSIRVLTCLACLTNSNQPPRVIISISDRYECLPGFSTVVVAKELKVFAPKKLSVGS